MQELGRPGLESQLAHVKSHVPISACFVRTLLAGTPSFETLHVSANVLLYAFGGWQEIANTVQSRIFWALGDQRLVYDNQSGLQIYCAALAETLYSFTLCMVTVW